jgi:hypothetical protein
MEACEAMTFQGVTGEEEVTGEGIQSNGRPVLLIVVKV